MRPNAAPELARGREPKARAPRKISRTIITPQGAGCANSYKQTIN